MRSRLRLRITMLPVFLGRHYGPGRTCLSSMNYLDLSKHLAMGSIGAGLLTSRLFLQSLLGGYMEPALLPRYSTRLLVLTWCLPERQPGFLSAHPSLAVTSVRQERQRQPLGHHRKCRPTLAELVRQLGSWLLRLGRLLISVLQAQEQEPL